MLAALRVLHVDISIALGTGMEGDLTNREIAAHLGVSSGVVEKLKREVRGGEAWDRNSEERAARMNRAREALGLQAQGRSRVEICQRMSLSPETVKMLLRDAKFYADPASDPVRRTLAYAAAAARRDGVVRSKFQADQGLTKPKSAEAWKDADVLPPSGVGSNTVAELLTRASGPTLDRRRGPQLGLVRL